jgi:release factor glutamine methyltransferase
MIADGVVDRLREAGCVYAEDEAALLLETADDAADLERLVEARIAGQPLEQLLGWVSFGGLRVAVGPGVFVPRVRTELLAERAVALVDDPRTVVVELCCGVAAVCAVLQHRRPKAELYASDIDPAAVALARRNLAQPAVVTVGDLFEGLPGSLRGRVDVLVANAPYVPTDAIALMPREARDHEPRVALDGGSDGTCVHRRIIAQAPGWLRQGGRLLIETGRAQSAITAEEMRRRGLLVEVVVDDERDATVVAGRWLDG